MTDSPALLRNLNLPMVVLYGLGNILGAGIYVLIGKVAGEAGYLAPVSFLVASLVAGITAFSFAELSSRFPVSAGAAIYIREGFNNSFLSLVIGLLIILTGVVSAATMSRGFAGYLDFFIELPNEVILFSLLAALGLLAIWGIAESVSVAAIFTVLEVSGLLLILYVAAPAFTEPVVNSDELMPTAEWSSWVGIFGGAFLAFYAFVGFEDMVNLAEEIKNPKRNMPIAIILALAIATVVYVLIALSSVLVLTPEQLQASEAPLADIYRTATEQDPWFISIVSLCAVVNGALIQIIMGSRVTYGLSKQGLLPGIFAKVNSRTQTPILATTVVTAVTITAALWFPLETLARTTSYLLLTLFCLVNLSLVKVKLHGVTHPNTFTVPVFLPVAGFMSCVLLLVLQLLST